MRGAVLRCAVLILVSASLWAQVPAGWRTLRSVSKPPATMSEKVIRDGKCAIAVPGDWLDDATVDRSQAHSRDGKSNAFVQEWPSKPHLPTYLSRKDHILADYRNQKANWARLYHKDVVDLKVLEDSPARLKVVRVTTAPLSLGITDWTLLSAGDPICYAMVFVSGTGPTDPGPDRAAAQRLLPTADQIVASFVPAR